MKIEKINDNQIRCTLTQADLVEHQLKLSELAFGTDKAKEFFREMMEQAAYQYGFEIDNAPLMIEAVPGMGDTLTLVITKVDDPNELDQRFSKFGKGLPESNGSQNSGTSGNGISFQPANKLDGAETLMDLLEKIQEKIEKSQKKGEDSKEKTSANDGKDTPDLHVADENNSLRLFSFARLDHVIAGARLLKGMYDGSNTLYKDTSEDVYVLAMSISDYSANEFNRICNMMTEYGTAEKYSGAMLAYLEEHCKVILSMHAVQDLAELA